MKVKEIAASAEKFAMRGTAAGPDYGKGTASAAPDWQRRTADSTENWASGVQGAVTSGRFGRSITANAAGKYTRNTQGEGVRRYASGVQGAKGDWQTGFAPYADRLRALELAPKGPKGDPRNYSRVQQVGQALRETKVGAGA